MLTGAVFLGSSSLLNPHSWKSWSSVFISGISFDFCRWLSWKCPSHLCCCLSHRNNVHYWHSLGLGLGLGREPLCILPHQTAEWKKNSEYGFFKADLDGCRSCICRHRRNPVGHQNRVKHQYCSCSGYKICFLLFLLNNDILFNTHSQFHHISFILWSNTNRQQVDSLRLGSTLSIETWTTLRLRPSVPGSLCLSTTCGLGYVLHLVLLPSPSDPRYCWSTVDCGARVQTGFTVFEDFACAVHMQRYLDSQVSLSDTE